jgi:hypothetical protein
MSEISVIIMYYRDMKFVEASLQFFLIETNIPRPETSLVPGQGRGPKVKDRGCDNALPDLGYRTNQGLMMGEYCRLVQ